MPGIHISESKRAAQLKRMADLGILEADLVEKFILGSGSGGQKVNKTASCVYLKHLPTGKETKNQSTRSREANRFFARREICDKLEEERLGAASRRQQAHEKIRRQKRRRSRRQRDRMLDDKTKHAEKKKRRRSVDSD